MKIKLNQKAKTFKNLVAASLIAIGVASSLAKDVSISSVAPIVVGLIALFGERLQRKQQVIQIIPPIKEMRELTDYILKARDLLNVDDLGQRVAEQLGQLNERYRRFQELLAKEFSVDQKNFEEYRWPAEKVYLSVIDHLHGVSLTLNSMNAMDPNNEAKKAVRLKQTEIVKSTLSFNEKTIQELERISAALLAGDAPNVRVELVALAKRAKDYSITAQLSK